MLRRFGAAGYMPAMMKAQCIGAVEHPLALGLTPIRRAATVPSDDGNRDNSKQQTVTLTTSVSVENRKKPADVGKTTLGKLTAADIMSLTFDKSGRVLRPIGDVRTDQNSVYSAPLQVQSLESEFAGSKSTDPVNPFATPTIRGPGFGK